MKRIICSLLIAGGLAVLGAGAMAATTFKSCGAGYILVPHSNVDGIPAEECQKLWCRDLETGKAMGTGKSAASGYVATNSPHELCDIAGNCIECFGDRKWCAGETAGEWNAEYGAYTRGGADNATYLSYKKDNCFAWRLEKPNCPDGEAAVLKGGKWICATASSGGTNVTLKSSVRRTGAARRAIR